MNIPDYVRDPAEIYRQSFARIESETDLSVLPENMRGVAIRIIHACGMVDAVADLAFSENAIGAGISALRSGASIFADVEMVKSGIIRKRLPANNEIICTLNDERVADCAKKIGNTRSAAAVDFWDERLQGSIVVIGNAPTALFRLLERLDGGGPKPALIIGIPVGFVGATESKQELAANPRGCAFVALHGRRGGSAIAASVLNAIAADCAIS